MFMRSDDAPPGLVREGGRRRCGRTRIAPPGSSATPAGAAPPSSLPVPPGPALQAGYWYKR